MSSEKPSFENTKRVLKASSAGLLGLFAAHQLSDKWTEAELGAYNFASEYGAVERPTSFGNLDASLEERHTAYADAIMHQIIKINYDNPENNTFVLPNGEKISIAVVDLTPEDGRDDKYVYMISRTVTTPDGSNLQSVTHSYKVESRDRYSSKEVLWFAKAPSNLIHHDFEGSNPALEYSVKYYFDPDQKKWRPADIDVSSGDRTETNKPAESVAHLIGEDYLDLAYIADLSNHETFEGVTNIQKSRE